MGLIHSTTKKIEKSEVSSITNQKNFAKRKRKIKCNELALAATDDDTAYNDTKKKRLQSVNYTPLSSIVSTTSASCRLFTNILSIKSLQHSERGSYLAAFFTLFGKAFSIFFSFITGIYI